MLHPLLQWLARPQDWFRPEMSPAEQAAEAAVDRHAAPLAAVLVQRALALCFSAWRVYLAQCCFLRQEEADKSALVIALWRATTAGLLDARGSAQASSQATALAGVAGLLGLHDSDDDSDDDDGL